MSEEPVVSDAQISDIKNQESNKQALIAELHANHLKKKDEHKRKLEADARVHAEHLKELKKMQERQVNDEKTMARLNPSKPLEAEGDLETQIKDIKNQIDEKERKKKKSVEIDSKFQNDKKNLGEKLTFEEENRLRSNIKTREKLRNEIQVLKNKLEKLYKKPEQNPEQKPEPKPVSLSEIISKLKESGGTIIITQTGTECYIRVIDKGADNIEGEYKSLPNDPKEVVIKSGQRIIIKKNQGDTLQYKILEEEDPSAQSANNKNGYLLYTVSDNKHIDLKHIDLIKPQQGSNIFDILVDKLQGRYFVLIGKNGGYVGILSRFMINVHDYIDEYQKILYLISKIIRTVHSLYSKFQKEQTQNELINSLNDQLKKLKETYTSLEPQLVNGLTDLKTETNKYSSDWLPFLKTIDEIKTEFINTLININILFETTIEERQSIIENNLKTPGKPFGDSVFEIILKQYFDDLDKFFNSLIKLTNDFKEYEFNNIEDIQKEESEIIIQDYDDEEYENEGDLAVEDFEE